MHLASKSAFWLALIAIIATACAAQAGGQVKSVGIDSFPVALASNEFVLVNFYVRTNPVRITAPVPGSHQLDRSHSPVSTFFHAGKMVPLLAQNAAHLRVGLGRVCQLGCIHASRRGRAEGAGQAGARCRGAYVEII